MILFPKLDELGSALTGPMLAVGICLLLPLVVDKRRNLHRALILTVSAILAIRYAWWRATQTLAPAELSWDMAASWSFFGLEFIALLGTLSSFAIMSRIRDRRAEATAHANWWGENDPRVAILIATYNETLEVLERTIIGARSLRYRNKEIIVLDDSRRDWLRDYCASQSVRYMRRPDNKGSKAGNINHTLARLAEDPIPPDFVAVLDADFVPHRGFVSRSLALFHDPKVGLVQTPQHFFNPDPIQHNLGLSRSYPDEQRFFFDHLQPCRDGWDIAICCGTSSIIRWQALRDIGGLPTDSVTEDFLLTLTLQSRGWSTAYLGEPLSEGLAPEGMKEYVTQRARWCLGLMQIARSSMGPLSRNTLRLRDRWSVIDSVLFWTTSFPFRLAAVIYPLLYWYFDLIVVNASLTDVISIFGTFFLWTLLSLRILVRGMFVPILHDVSQLVGAIAITRAAYSGLFRPKGHPFSVTAKGGDRSRVVIQWRLMAPFLVLLGLTGLGLWLGIMNDGFAFGDAGDGKWVVLFWTIYNLVVLLMTCLACVELPRRELHVADQPERAIFIADGREARTHWITSLTLDTVSLRGRHYAAGTRGVLRISDVGDVAAQVIADTIPDGTRLKLLPDGRQREALFLRFYADGEAPGIGGARTLAVLADIARKFTFSRLSTGEGSR